MRAAIDVQLSKRERRSPAKARRVDIAKLPDLLRKV